jgi:hypothetical protein
MLNDGVYVFRFFLFRCREQHVVRIPANWGAGSNRWADRLPGGGNLRGETFISVVFYRLSIFIMSVFVYLNFIP